MGKAGQGAIPHREFLIPSGAVPEGSEAGKSPYDFRSSSADDIASGLFPAVFHLAEKGQKFRSHCIGRNCLPGNPESENQWEWL